MSTGPRHPDRTHERAPDPAEAANRPLESKSPHRAMAAEDIPEDQPDLGADPHHVLNTPVGEPDPVADSDPYAAQTPEDEADRASGVRGSGQGAEDR